MTTNWRRLFRSVYRGTIGFVLVYGSLLATVAIAPWLVPKVTGEPCRQTLSMSDRMTLLDGGHYRSIVKHGYTYSRRAHSTIVFFPAYPITVRAIVRLTGASVNLVLLFVSAVCFLFSLIAIDLYVDDRFPGIARVRRYAIASLALFPTAFFMCMAYTEAMFVLLSIATLYGMRRHWPPLMIALSTGAATATRSVGIALVPLFVIYYWRASRSGSGGRQSRDNQAIAEIMGIAWRCGRGLVLTGVACWGIIAFMLYQARTFHDPFAFVKAQMVWRQRSPISNLGYRAVSLATLEPIRSTYSRESPCFWKTRKPYDDALLNLQFVNPILFLFMFCMLVIGVIFKWLDGYEVALGALLLIIPYVVQTSRQCMTSQGRFVAVVWPSYIVLGHLLARLPSSIAVYLLAISGLLMLMYAAMFCCQFPFM